NMRVVAPRAGFNTRIRELTARHGVLMISDEVLTGFRVSPAGWFGLEGVVPDLFTFGKVVGGGMPLAALGGRADLMTQLAPLGPVYQAGTLSGNPLSTAAGIATLRLADTGVYAQVDRVAGVIGDAASAALADAGVAHSLQRAGNLFSIMFGDLPDGGAPHGPWGAGAVADYAGAKAQEAWRYPAFFHAMLDAGIALPPSVFEAWFVSSAHDDAAVGRILEALPVAARAAAEAQAPA
ncbi:MAG: aminotransferase class III-fold pyridoxal phosphate-dependent enzyme, partial [Actinomycetota bacterium]